MCLLPVKSLWWERKSLNTRDLSLACSKNPSRWYSQTCFSWPPLLINHLYYVSFIFISLHLHFISNKSVLSDHLSYVTIFHCSLGRSHVPSVLCDHISLFPWKVTCTICLMWPYFTVPLEGHMYHLSFVTIFHCSLGRSHVPPVLCEHIWLFSWKVT